MNCIKASCCIYLFICSPDFNYIKGFIEAQREFGNFSKFVFALFHLFKVNKVVTPLKDPLDLCENTRKNAGLGQIWTDPTVGFKHLIKKFKNSSWVCPYLTYTWVETTINILSKKKKKLFNFCYCALTITICPTK